MNDKISMLSVASTSELDLVREFALPLYADI